jgi:hypothetical protein
MHGRAASRGASQQATMIRAGGVPQGPGPSAPASRQAAGQAFSSRCSGHVQTRAASLYMQRYVEVLNVER